MQDPAVPHHEPRCHREQATAPGHFDYGKARSCVPAPALTPPPNGERNPINTKSDYAISLLKPYTGSQETQSKSQSHWDLCSLQALALVALDLTATASPVHLLWPCRVCPGARSRSFPLPLSLVGSIAMGMNVPFPGRPFLTADIKEWLSSPDTLLLPI